MTSNYKNIFDKRKQLKEVNPIVELDSFNFEKFYIDSWYNKPFYGKVDTSGFPIILREQRIKFATVGTDLFQVQAVDFVADLFKNAKKEYESFYRSGFLNKKSTFFKERLSAVKGFTTSRETYLIKLKSIYADLISNIQENQNTNKISDYHTFLETVKNFIFEKDLYLTRAGFVESNDVSPLNTGLMLDIYDGNASDTSLKEKFYKDINYPAFLEICLKNGFLINREIPWRIVCDIRQKKVEEKIIELNQNYNINFDREDFRDNLQKIFDVYYESVLPVEEKYFDYFKEFMTVLEGFYKSYIFQFPSDKIFELNECDNAKINLIPKKSIPRFEDLDDMYRFYLKLYFDFRKIEIRDNIDDKNFDYISAISISKFNQLVKNNFKDAVCQAIKTFSVNLTTLTYREKSIIEGGPIKGPA